MQRRAGLCAILLASAAWCGGAGGTAEVRDWGGLEVRRVSFSRAQNERLEGQCRLCEEGTYQALASATGQRACLACPPHASSPLGATSLLDCVCLPGFTGIDGGPCLACDAGTFKEAAGSGSCTLCAPGSFSLAGAFACTACSPGTYEPETGSAGCSSTCPAFTSSLPGGTTIANCTCAEGYTGTYPDNPCAACEAGSHKPTQGSAACEDCPAGTFAAAASSVCTQCPASTYSAAAASACELCPQFKVSPAGSASEADCLCAAGYMQFFNGNCFPCPAGLFTPEPGVAMCRPCEPGTYASAQTSTACTLCPEGTYSAQMSSACENCPVLSDPACGTRLSCPCHRPPPRRPAPAAALHAILSFPS